MFFLIRTAGRGSRGRAAQGAGASWLKLWAMCFALAVPIAGIAALFHAVDHHAPPAPITRAGHVRRWQLRRLRDTLV